jgi:YjbE family integral membrane protein
MEFWMGLLSIVLIDLVVGGDNALVIALASRNLPEAARKRAVLWGTAGAVGIRMVLTVAALYLLQIPFLQAVGGLFLLVVAVKLLKDNGHEIKPLEEGLSFGKAVRTIIMADLVLSLDNVLAVAGAGHGNFLLVLLGLAISVPIVVWGSGLVLKLINRFPWMVNIGAGVLGWTAGSMLVEDRMLAPYLSWDVWHWIIPALATALVLLLGRRPAEKRDPVGSL